MTTKPKNDDYKIQLLDYAKFLANERLRAKGKLFDDVEPVYVIYARKSTKGKDRQERSIPDQILDCQKVVKTLGITPVKIFREEESAKTAGRRSLFSEMISGIKDGKYNSIISWHPDRLARNMKDAGEIIDLLDRGLIVDLKFAQYTFVRDANGIMTLGIQFVLAKQYSDNLSASSSRGSINIAREGKSPTHKPKYGYILKDSYFRPDGNNFKLLQQAFNLVLDGNGLAFVSNYLNENNFGYKGKKMNMTKQKLSGVLKDPFYAGVYLYGTEVIDLLEADPMFEPMVTSVDFLELRRRLKDTYSFRKRVTKVKLFSKMVYCGYCGNVMSPGVSRSGGKSSNRYLTLRCSKKECPGHFDKAIKRGLRGKVLVDFILDLIGTGFEVDKTAYEEYKKEVNIGLLTYRESCLEQLKSIRRQITENKEIKERKTNALANAKGELIDELNQQIDGISIKVSGLKEKEKELQGAIITVDHHLQTESITYENFLNFFKNIGNLVKNSDNQYLVDKIIRMVFLNFTIEDQKVTKYSLNTMFSKYVKIPSVLPSREYRIRTCNLTHPMRAR